MISRFFKTEFNFALVNIHLKWLACTTPFLSTQSNPVMFQPYSGSILLEGVHVTGQALVGKQSFRVSSLCLQAGASFWQRSKFWKWWRQKLCPRSRKGAHIWLFMVFLRCLFLIDLSLPTLHRVNPVCTWNSCAGTYY